MSLSIIIPTYKNVNFLSELVRSIIINHYEDDYEVLIGIDGCDETLSYVHQNEYPENFKIFYFFDNKGPYLIKNTLAKISKYDKILFFDSDDVMMPEMMKEIDNGLKHYDVIKPKYINFKDTDKRIYEYDKPQFGEGVFAIKKSLFLYMNGFEGWKVAADSDFMGRLYKMSKRILHTNFILFHRRTHPNSLTLHPNTGFRSKLRSHYVSRSKQKGKNDIINKTLMVSEFKKVDLNDKDLSKYNIEVQKEKEVCIMDQKKQQHDLISDIFTIRPTIMKVGEEPKRIDYNRVNSQTNYNPKNAQITNALSKAKLENIKKIRRS